MEKHPEQREGEIFLTNVCVSNESDLLRESMSSSGIHSVAGGPADKDWGVIGYRTKRAGKIAYTSDGKAIPWMRPVFVSREEFSENKRRGKAL